MVWNHTSYIKYNRYKDDLILFKCFELMCFYQEISIINHFTKTFNQSDETIMIGHLSNLDIIERAFVILFIIDHPRKDAVVDVQKRSPSVYWMYLITIAYNAF